MLQTALEMRIDVLFGSGDSITLDSAELDVAPQYASQVRKIVEAYVPSTKVKSEVEKKIIVYDETPVRWTPKRLAPGEKAVVMIDE